MHVLSLGIESKDPNLIVWTWNIKPKRSVDVLLPYDLEPYDSDIYTKP